MFAHDAVRLTPMCTHDAVRLTLMCTHDAVRQTPMCAHDAVRLTPMCAPVNDNSLSLSQILPPSGVNVYLRTGEMHTTSPDAQLSLSKMLEVCEASKLPKASINVQKMHSLSAGYSNRNGFMIKAVPNLQHEHP